MEIVKAFNENKMHTNITIKGTYDNPLFRASDIGEVLEISNIRTSIIDFGENEKVVHTTDTLGGKQQVAFLTEKGLYKILFKSRKPIAKTFQNWVCEVIKEIRLQGSYHLEKELKEKEELLKLKDEELEENKKMLEDLEKIKENEEKPTIYIYNIDTRNKEPELKIGYTMNIYKRIKPYKQVCKFGKIEFMSVIYSSNIRTVENYIHFLLEKYNVKDEIFKIEVDEAIVIINNVINMINVVQINNSSERNLKLKKMFEQESFILKNEKNMKISTNTIGTQTDFDESVPLSKPLLFNDNELNNKFNEFINNFCIIREDVEVNCKDIIGQYRLWSKNTKKEITIAFKNYLDTKFKYCRLKNQDKNQVVNGYKGVSLKEIKHQKSLTPCEAETFIFEKCFFTPGGTLLKNNLINEFIEWKKNIQKQITNKEENEIIHYLKTNENVLYSTVWTSEGSGQGYYGIIFKNQIKDYKKPSTTSKKVEKREIQTNQLLGTWDTISKASESEGISSAKMSRSIKSKNIFNNDYYYCIKS